MSGTMQEKLRALSDPSLRAQLHQEAAEGDSLPYTFFTKHWDRIFVTKPALEKNASLKGRNIASIAQERGAGVVDTFLDLAVEEGLETGFVLEQVAGADEEAMKALLNSPHVVMSLSDSGTHVVYDPGYGFWVVVQFESPKSETISSAVQIWSVAPAAIAGVRR